jgi:MoxR-like ATPase
MPKDTIEHIGTLVESGAENLVERRILFELVVLGILAQEHLLMVGPPGTGKSAAVRAVSSYFSGKHFEYLLGRFTEPSELFGAVSLSALTEGRVEAVTENMLPEANVAFLDEVFLGSTAILNTLLAVLNERTYRRGAQVIDVPLWSCIAASNGLPEDPMLSAFADRFLLTTFVEPVEPDNVEKLLEAGWANASSNGKSDLKALTVSDIEKLQERVLQVDLSHVRSAYSHIIRKLTVKGLRFSDRRMVKGQKLIAAAALLSGRAKASLADLWPVIYMVQDHSLQEQAKEILAEELQSAQSAILDQSAKTAAYGPAAYAADLATDAQKHLEGKPQLREDPKSEVWAVRAETLLARIDAGFTDDSIPETLSMAKTALLAALK